MKIVSADNEKKTIKMSRKEWEDIGRTAGWKERELDESKPGKGWCKKCQKMGVGYNNSEDTDDMDLYCKDCKNPMSAQKPK